MRRPCLALCIAISSVVVVTRCGATEEKKATSPAGEKGSSEAGSTGSTATTGEGDEMGGSPETMAADVVGDEKETPPMGKTKLDGWLAAGHYKAWKCEAEAHASRPPSAHGDNRICSNAMLANAGDAGEYPAGAASVKELFDASKKLNGYAVMLKTSAGADGEKWYWYEIIDTRVVADGQGTTGKAKSICVSCHVAAGKSGNTGRDHVFTQVK